MTLGASSRALPADQPSAQALPIIAAADADTTGSNGAAATITVVYSDWPAVEECLAFLRFDVASALPANAVIDSAVMSVYLSAIGSSTNQLPVQVPAYLVRSAWNEYTLNWSNQPSLCSFFVSAWINYPTGWKSWDVTTWARSWLADPTQNYGVALKGPHSSRYYLYFSTRESSQKPVLSVTYHTASLCDTVSEIPGTECQALVELYNGTGGPAWTTRTNWLATNTPCSWFGVTCSGGHVTRLSLYSNHLVGAMPASLGNLSALQTLALSQNQLTGAIPSTLGSLANLQTLFLFANQLNGAIPGSLGSLSHLTHLLLAGNQLTGGIPSALGGLASLQELALSSNPLGGTIPASLGGLSSLRRLELSDNQLTGGVPGALGGLANLTHLFLSQNGLTGGIPGELGGLSSLRNLSLSSNQLTGGIPSALGGLSSLVELSLADNQLTGGVPESLGGLPGLLFLYLQANPLAGALPASLTNLALREFFFENTNLCEPADAAFQAWLAGIPSLGRTGVLCSSPTTTAVRTPTPTGVATQTCTTTRTATRTATAGATPTHTGVATLTRTGVATLTRTATRPAASRAFLPVIFGQRPSPAATPPTHPPAQGSLRRPAPRRQRPPPSPPPQRPRPRPSASFSWTISTTATWPAGRPTRASGPTRARPCAARMPRPPSA